MTKKLLWANVRANLIYYRRNRLLVIVALLILGLFGVSTIPSLLFYSTTQRFQIVTSLYGQLSGYLTMIVGLIALLSIHYHRSQKCVKLVFTRPCTPEVWVASHYVSAMLVYVVGMAIVLAVTFVLMLSWNIPLQWAIFAAALYDFIVATLVFAYLSTLSTLFHPLVGLVLYFILNDQIFYWLMILVRVGYGLVENAFISKLLPLADTLLETIYVILPTSGPFAEQLSKLGTGFRMEVGDGKYLLLSMLYLVLFTALAYTTTVYILRRQRQA